MVATTTATTTAVTFESLWGAYKPAPLTTMAIEQNSLQAAEEAIKAGNNAEGERILKALMQSRQQGDHRDWSRRSRSRKG